MSDYIIEAATKEEWAARAKAAEAELAEDAALLEECEAVIIAQRTRIAQLEALLPRAWLAGVEAAVGECEMGAHIMSHYGSQTQETSYTNAAHAIRAQPTPTAADLLVMLKENDDE